MFPPEMPKCFQEQQTSCRIVLGCFTRAWQGSLYSTQPCYVCFSLCYAPSRLGVQKPPAYLETNKGQSSVHSHCFLSQGRRVLSWVLVFNRIHRFVGLWQGRAVRSSAPGSNMCHLGCQPCDLAPMPPRLSMKWGGIPVILLSLLLVCSEISSLTFWACLCKYFLWLAGISPYLLGMGWGANKALGQPLRLD